MGICCHIYTKISAADTQQDLDVAETAIGGKGGAVAVGGAGKFAKGGAAGAIAKGAGAAGAGAKKFAKKGQQKLPCSICLNTNINIQEVPLEGLQELQVSRREGQPNQEQR